MTKTVSARIPNKIHSELIERCNKSGCTINEWINEAIQFTFSGTSDFDFGDEVITELETKSQDTDVDKTLPKVKVKWVSD